MEVGCFRPVEHAALVGLHAQKHVVEDAIYGVDVVLVEGLLPT